MDKNSVLYLPPSDFSATTCRMSVERFCTTTPLRRTVSGRRGSAALTRLLTFTAAISALVPTSNVAVMVTTPLAAADEVKYSMFSTPLSCSSIGAATVLDRVSADAPG